MRARLRFGEWLPRYRHYLPYAVGLAVLFVGYTCSLRLSYALPWRMASQAAVLNLIPAAIGAAVVRLALFRLWRHRRAWVQAVGHTMLAVFFMTFWLWLQAALLGSFRAGSVDNFTVKLLAGPGAGWQLMQGLTIYAVIALLTQLEIERRKTCEALPPASLESVQPKQFFVKDGDEFRPLDPTRIVLARGADDYVELVTDAGKHLARMTLARCAEQLGANFLRVHRSCVINASRVARAEPSGDGRLLVAMDNGELVHTSRAGARLLRERVI